MIFDDLTCKFAHVIYSYLDKKNFFILKIIRLQLLDTENFLEIPSFNSLVVRFINFFGIFH